MAVAGTLTGTPTTHASVPYVWTEQLGGRLQVFGRVRPQDDLHVLHGSLDAEFVAVTVDDDGRLQAAVGIGAPKALIRYRKLLADGAGWAEARAITETTAALMPQR
jgi:3-phenylpropionate/trans-cinnamate dioxygenase ferredoxin reductase subunit